MNMYEGPIDGARGGGGIKGGRWAWVGLGKVVVEKWRQLYTNNNKKCFSSFELFSYGRKKKPSLAEN